MKYFLKTVLSHFAILFLLVSCTPNPLQEEIAATFTPSFTPDIQATEFLEEIALVDQTEEPDSLSEKNRNDYGSCGSGSLIEVPYFFTDENFAFSPTQLIRILPTSDNVRTDVMVITCLVHDEGWLSNPEEVENGYENEVVFFDKHGIGHHYRLIIGGHYINPYDPSHKDINGSLNGIDEQYYTVDEWMKITKNDFESKGVRQIGLSIYLEDTQGNMSKVLSQVYGFRETNLQIAKALQAGDGYPEQVPDGFFLFATKSWLITPD